MFPPEKETIFAILNLPEDLSRKQIFDEYQLLILSDLENISDEDIFTLIETETAEQNIITRYTFSYCYLLFAYTVEFLNLKTLGEGIIKSTGIDGQSAELLSGNEIKKMRRAMEIKALETISEHLNSEGIERLRELKLNTTRLKRTRTKVALI